MSRLPLVSLRKTNSLKNKNKKKTKKENQEPSTEMTKSEMEGSYNLMLPEIDSSFAI